jgi:2-oxoglutarate/2-oxoacid ferredoxin oxidoreductase subunit beta
MEESMDTAINEAVVYQPPEALVDIGTSYCPGCTHGLIHKLIAEVIDELGIREKTIGVYPVGCSVFAYEYFDFDGVVASHGRAPAMATGIKRVDPSKIVFTYQGDGDLASIGMGEIIWAANRGEKLTAFFINNAVFGMTGGQMAPTTLAGQVTSSSPKGRDVETTGMPLRMAEFMAQIPGAVYVVRRSVFDIMRIKQAKKAIATAFKTQMSGAGFAMVEFLSTCPTNWGLKPLEAMHWMEEEMQEYFPLGDYKVADIVKNL